MKKPGIVAYYIFIACLLFIITGVFYGWLTFGHGLGDLFYLICLAPVTIVLTVLFIIVRKRTAGSSLSLLLLLGIISSLLFFFGKLSYFRGTEYPWNGNLFTEWKTP